jgi:putative acetyltransferase
MEIIKLKRTNSANPDFRLLVAELDADLRTRNGEVMDIYDQHNIIEQINTVVIVYVDDVPAGCGCFKKFNADAVEIKRMFVRHNFRGKRLSATILKELEKWALEEGNYENIPKYEPYVDLPDSICFKKKLG